MGIYIKRSCPHCETVIEPYTRSYRAIGPPFIQCPNCGHLLRQDHVNEWALMYVPGKLAHIGIHFYTCIFWSFFFVIPFAVLYEMGKDVSDSLALLSWGAGFLVVCAIRSLSLIREIKQSNQRLTSPSYRAQLKQLGFFSD